MPHYALGVAKITLTNDDEEGERAFYGHPVVKVATKIVMDLS
jgi:hypothetical protein